LSPTLVPTYAEVVRDGFILGVGFLVVGLGAFFMGTDSGREVLVLWREGSARVPSQSIVHANPAPAALGSAPNAPAPDALRVLFVGNSHTFVNEMPKLIAALARAGGQRPLHFQMIARGGARLSEHAAEGHAQRVIAEGGWHAVVLQEQQQWPSFGEEQRKREMHAPARVLSLSAQAIGAKPTVMMVWARREGDPSNVAGDTFEGMHARSVLGHRELASDLGAQLAPVALAWKRALDARPELQLWQPDGSHPSLAGSYLGACVMYRSLYGASPSGLRFTAGLPERDAAFLQELAATTRAD
jgi:hypothetical protein